MSTPTQHPRKRLLCRLGSHRYVLRTNAESGEHWHECRYCGRFDPRSTSTGGWIGM
jgi:hypothetical protein